MNIDFNKNGVFDILEQQIQHASTSTISNFATVAKKASEIKDGANKCYFNKINKCLVIKHGNKPMTDCLQLGAKNNTINNVESIHFQNETTLMGLINNLSSELTEDEERAYAPSMKLLNSIIDPAFESFADNLNEINNKVHDISYDEEEEETTISNDLVVNGEIKSDWLDDEFAKYALLNHNHAISEITNLETSLNGKANVQHTHAMNEITGPEGSLPAMLTNLETSLNGKANVSHTHEFADIYKQTTRTIINETTNEEEEITETKTLQQVLNEYEQSLTNAINGKANVSHTHEISDIYKTVSVQNQDGTTTTTNKPLETLINEKDSALRTLINGKANSSHTHNATDIVYKTNENVKQAIDSINQQLDIKDENGNKIDILAAIFGTTTGVGALIDGGLVAAVGTLQEEVALLQTQMATLATSDLTNDVLDVVNSAGEVVEGGASVWKGLKGIANAWKQMRTAAAGYINLSNASAIPLMAL